MNFNYEYRIPNYTYHKLTVEQILPETGPKAQRRSSFFVDDINLKNESATNADYRGSGYDRGHMVPAGDFYSDKELKDETFAYANITPQNPILNRGIWAFLENSIRMKLLSLNVDAYIVTGIIMDTTNVFFIGINNVAVPNYLYKIVFIPDLFLIYTFMFDNMIYEYLGNLEDYQVKVDDIELLTGEDFFELIDDEIENYLESLKINFLY